MPSRLQQEQSLAEPQSLASPQSLAELQSLAAMQSRLRLFQFASQALPTGAYAYSNGLESLLHLNLLEGEEECTAYLISLLQSSVETLEVPLFARMYDAAKLGDRKAARTASHYLLASRESREFQEQEQQMARALTRVLEQLCPEVCEREDAPDGDSQPWQPATYSEALAFACSWYRFSRGDAALLLVYNWVEQHVSALCKLLLLGPLAGQRMLDQLLTVVPSVVSAGLLVPDDEIGAGAPLLSLASALHEHQYCRIFRT